MTKVPRHSCGGTAGKMPDKQSRTGEAASRIQSSEAKASGGGVEKGSFASRAQAAAAANANNPPAKSK